MFNFKFWKKKKNESKKPKTEQVKDKLSEHEKDLIKQYDNGKILQVDNKINNKEYFKKFNKKDDEQC